LPSGFQEISGFFGNDIAGIWCWILWQGCNMGWMLLQSELPLPPAFSICPCVQIK